MKELRATDLQGHAITRLLKSVSKVAADPRVQELSQYLVEYRSYFVELDNGVLFALCPFAEPLSLVDFSAEQLEPVTDCVFTDQPNPIGMTIEDVLYLSLSKELFLYLSNGTLLWVELGLGTTLSCAPRTYVEQSPDLDDQVFISLLD